MKNKFYTEEENLKLPIPRLEIRYRYMTMAESNKHGMGMTQVAEYRMVYRHLMGEVIGILLGETRCGDSDRGVLETPFRDGAHIVSDMLHLRLPGFCVKGNKFRQLHCEPDDYPNAVWDTVPTMKWKR